MADYAVELSAEGQCIIVPAPSGPITIEIDYSTGISSRLGSSGWGYVFDARTGTNAYIAWESDGGGGDIFFSGVSNFKIDGVAQAYTSNLTNWAGSGLDNLAGKTLSFDLTMSSAHALTIGARYNPKDTAFSGISAVRILQSGVTVREYNINEGSGLTLTDSLESPYTGANDATLTGFAGDDSQWILLGGGGAEDYSGAVQSIAAAISSLVGHKNAFGAVSQNESCDSQVSGTKSTAGVSSSTHAANTLINAAKKAATLLSSSNIVSSSVQAIGHRLASLVSSVTPQTENTGKKKGFTALVSSIVTGTSVSASTQRGGVIASSNTATTLIGAGESLLEVYGYSVSSNVPTTLVNGFKAALGAAASIQTTQSNIQGRKQAQGDLDSNTGTATSLLAFAARAGWIESVGVARTFVTGMNPEANIPKRRYSITVTRPSVSLVCHRNSQLTYRAVI